MVLVGRTRYREVLERIKEGANEAGGCSAILFVAPECDALCACHVVTVRNRTRGLTTRLSHDDEGNERKHRRRILPLFARPLILVRRLVRTQHLLRSEHVQYKIKPAAGLEDLKRANETLVKDNDEVRNESVSSTRALPSSSSRRAP